MKKIAIALGLSLFASVGLSQTASAQSEPFVGQVMTTAANYCPRGWAPMEGQLLPIAQNQALYSLLGTLYGGDGRSSFALPDTRGRAVLNVGSSPGLPPAQQGQRGTAGASGTGGTPTLVLRQCIALDGIYPPRS
tara:strand:- start:1063 stop:1467 length:405 start_codon:yes stop_codon:yes gene_type:complete